MRLCFFGDSFTNGTGDDSCLGWVGRVCADARSRGHDLTAYNLGIRRDTSADILARWQDEALRRLFRGCSPGLVFAFGNNDVAPAEDGGEARVPLADTLRNSDAIIAAARKLAPTLLIGPVPWMGDESQEGRIAELSRALSRLGSACDVPYLDLLDAPHALGALWRAEAEAGDGAHPNSGGYSAMAQHIASWPAWRAWFP